MSWIEDNILRFEKLADNINELPKAIEIIISNNEDILIDLNRDQLLSGRNSDGNLLTPDYLSDPYFKTRKQATYYSNMKYRLENFHRRRITFPLIYPDKPKDTPNLIVSGAMQDRMFINIGSDNFNIFSTYEDTSDISSKYNDKVFGIAPLSIEYFWNNILSYELKKHLLNGL